jgi:hypothetical protein
MRNVSNKSCREYQNTHFKSNNFFFNHTVYAIMLKNSVQPNRPQMTIRRMHIACWITKATDIHSEYVICIAFPLQEWLHEHTSMLCYMYISFLVCPNYKCHSDRSKCITKTLTWCWTHAAVLFMTVRCMICG